MRYLVPIVLGLFLIFLAWRLWPTPDRIRIYPDHAEMTKLVRGEARLPEGNITFKSPENVIHVKNHTVYCNECLVKLRLDVYWRLREEVDGNKINRYAEIISDQNLDAVVELHNENFTWVSDGVMHIHPGKTLVYLGST